MSGNLTVVSNSVSMQMLVRKQTFNMCSNSGGFIALLFVLALSSALTLLVFVLTQKSAYVISLLDGLRKNESARSAVLYCKEKLFNNLIHNIDYLPILNVDVLAPYGAICRYDSIARIFPLTPPVYEGIVAQPSVIYTDTVYISGYSSRNATTSGNLNDTVKIFTAKYEYSATNAIFDYIVIRGVGIWNATSNSSAQ